MKKPRLTDMDRLRIESMLREGKTLYAIAKELARPVSTITREVKSRAVESNKGAAYRVANRCALKMTCTQRNVCAYCPYDEKRQCKFCRLCNSNCPLFVEQKCERLENPPFVCNGCKDENKCVLRKRFYLHKAAQKSYETTLSESRSGANITEEELLAFDSLLFDLTAKGQSIFAAMSNNPDRFSICPKTCYRYVNAGLLSTKRHNLPRACMLKPRAKKSMEHKVDKKCRIGRTYEDYRNFMEKNPGLRVVQMDIVEGVKGGKVLLTLMFNPFRFMVAFLLEEKSSDCVIKVFQSILTSLTKRFGEDEGREMFSRLFPVILTDNGTEFSNPTKIEFDRHGNKLTSIFYCDPHRPDEKGACEKNHVELRKIAPKGDRYFKPTSFNSFTQEDISLMMSHINGYIREKLKGIPYTLFTREYGTEVASLLGISHIDPNEVTLKPSLLGIEVEIKDWVFGL